MGKCYFASSLRIQEEISELNSKRINSNVRTGSLPVTDVGLGEGQWKSSWKPLLGGFQPSRDCHPEEGAELSPKGPRRSSQSPLSSWGSRCPVLRPESHTSFAILPCWSNPLPSPFHRPLRKHGLAFNVRLAGREASIPTGGRKEKVPFFSPHTP